MASYTDIEYNRMSL